MNSPVLYGAFLCWIENLMQKDLGQRGGTHQAKIAEILASR